MSVKNWIIAGCLIVLPLNFADHLQDNGLTKGANNQWTQKDRLEYAQRNDDPAQWDMKMLREDLNAKSKRNWPTNPAISDYPSPVAGYDWGYAALGSLSVDIAKKRLKGVTVSYATGKYRPSEEGNCFYNRYFNILFLTDKEDSQNSANHIVSRNYPHYLATGKQKTSMGEIDWVQMHRADGDNFAIVNQRYFDLNFGRTLVVIPHQDGSIRILQSKHNPTSIRKKQTAEETKIQLDDFYQTLRNDPKLVKALSNNNVIVQPIKK